MNGKEVISKTELSVEQREKLILDYMHIVKKHVGRIASKLAISEPPLDDMESAGYLGLINAATRFDPSVNAEFGVYADFRVKGAILDELRSIEWAPRSVMDKMKMLRQATLQAEIAHGGAVSGVEVAETLGISMDEYFKLQRAAHKNSLISLEAELTREHSLRWSDVLDSGATNADDYLIQEEAKMALKESLKQLSDEDISVLELLYIEDMNQKEIALLMGVSESRISKIHAESIRKITKSFNAKFQDEFDPRVLRAIKKTQKEKSSSCGTAWGSAAGSTGK